MKVGMLPKYIDSINLNYKMLDTLPYKDKIIRQVIKRLKLEKDICIQNDTLGILFEKLLEEQDKKNLGQFYTPQIVVDYIIDYLKIHKNSKILDPTCGCGIFLVSMYNYLKFKKKYQNVLGNLYGVDLNDSAAKITRLNLWFRDSRTRSNLNLLENNIRIGNSIVENKSICKKAFNWNKEFSGIFEQGGFDFIIGNPPYVTLKNGSDYDINDMNFRNISNGSTNAASLIVAKSFELLKDNGVMAFVLPKTMLRVNSYSKLRSHILNRAKILHILNLGSGFKGVKGEQIVLFLQKSDSNNDENQISIRVISDKCLDYKSAKEFTISQSVFKKYNNFLIFDNPKIYSLIDKIESNGQLLSEISDIFRGFSVSPTSKCVSEKKTGSGLPIVKGNNIEKFRFKNGYFIDSSRIKLSQIKLGLMQNNKIIMQNIFSCEAGLISAVDYKKHLTFDTVTNIILKDKKIQIKYMHGLLNSKLINFYLMYAIYNKSKLTMHTDKIYLGKIPIIEASKRNQEKIIKIVELIERNPQMIKLHLADLDKQVYRLYNVNKSEIGLIDSSLKLMMSKKSIW